MAIEDGQKYFVNSNKALKDRLIFCILFLQHAMFLEFHKAKVKIVLEKVHRSTT